MTSREESPPPPPPPPPPKTSLDKNSSQTSYGYQYQQQPVHYGQSYSTMGNPYLYQQQTTATSSGTSTVTNATSGTNSQYSYQQTSYNPYQGSQQSTPQSAQISQYSYNNQGYYAPQNSSQGQQPSYSTSTNTTQSYQQYQDTTGYYNSSNNYDYAAYQTGNQYQSGTQPNYDSYNSTNYSYNDYYGSGYDAYGNYYGYRDGSQDQDASYGSYSYGQSNASQQDGKVWNSNSASISTEGQQKIAPQRDPRLEKGRGRGQAPGVGRGNDAHQVPNNERLSEKSGEGRGRGTTEIRPNRGGRGGVPGPNRGAYNGSYRGDNFDAGRQYEDTDYRRGPSQIPPMKSNQDDPPERKRYHDNRGSGYDQMYQYEDETYKSYPHSDRGWNRDEYWNRGWQEGYRDSRSEPGRERGGTRGRGDRGGGGARRGGIDRDGMTGRGRNRDNGGNFRNQRPPYTRGGSSHRGRGRGGTNLMQNDNKAYEKNQRLLPGRDQNPWEANDSIQNDNKLTPGNRNDSKDIKQAEKRKLEIKTEEQPLVKKPCKVEHKVGVKSSTSKPSVEEVKTEPVKKNDQITVSESQPPQQSVIKAEVTVPEAPILPDSTSKDNVTGPSPPKKKKAVEELLVDPDVEKALEEMTSPFFCKLCNLTISHPSQAQSHYNGKHHAKKVRLYKQSAALEATLARKAAQGDLVTTINLVTEVNPASDDKPKDENVQAISESVIEKMKDENDRVYCKLCQVAFNSPKQAIQHYEGKNHAKKMKAAGIVQISETDKQHVKIDGAVFECKMCSVQVTCNEQLQSHLNGAKHKGKLRSLERAADSNRGRWGGRGRGRGRGRAGHAGFAVEEHNVVTIQTQQQSRKRGRDYSNFRTPSGSYYCSICNVTVNGENQFAQHMDSRKHKSKYANHKITEEEQQQMEMTT
ncbi:uncharacterized protein LOC125681162 isoform X2 [Ostrea edulis]|uniref:uncharacterized protein LOC125681162 isoform X2 n=1 Tax=Ostrea edulis TaxID=37623 RepID=UPI0024AED3E4|nr:uncharacterized protein LOC125681162 isoform X2 [Ostrea edulis]